jgi:hypothetical protein
MPDEMQQQQAEQKEPSWATGTMKEFIEVREQGTDADLETPTPEQRNESEMGRWIRERNGEKSPQRGVEKRIGKLTAQKKEYLARAEAAESRLAQYEQQPQQQERQSGQYRAEDVEQQYSARNEETRRQAESQADRAAYKTFRSGVDELLGRYTPSEREEFHRAADKIEIPTEVAGRIISFENGADVWLYLAQHPEEARHLKNFKLNAAMDQINYISYRLRDAGKPKLESRAPAPISPVGSSSTKSSVPMDQMDMIPFMKARQYGRTR